MVEPFLIIIYVLNNVNYIRVMVANICLVRRVWNPKSLLYRRYMAALFPLILRHIFVIQKMNSSVISIQNKHD